jgi:hypothetical protein
MMGGYVDCMLDVLYTSYVAYVYEGVKEPTLYIANNAETVLFNCRCLNAVMP